MVQRCLGRAFHSANVHLMHFLGQVECACGALVQRRPARLSRAMSRKPKAILPETSHFVRAWRTLRGLTLEEVGSEIEMSSQNLGRIERGEVPLSEKHHAPLARALGIEPVELFRDPGSDVASDSDEPIGAIRQMPMISTVAAGQLADPSAPIEGEFITLEIGGLPAGDYFATTVEGDSMDRISPPGSIIVVDRSDRDLLPGRRYVFARRGKTTFKRYERDPVPRLVPESTNPSHDQIFPRSDEEWDVVGRVRMTMLRDL